MEFWLRRLSTGRTSLYDCMFFQSFNKHFGRRGGGHCPMQGIVKKGEVSGYQLILLQCLEPHRRSEEYTSVTVMLVSESHVTHAGGDLAWPRYREGFFFFFFFKNYLFIFKIFWLCWVFVALSDLSLAAVIWGYSSLQCAGFSLLRSINSRHPGVSSCSLWTL